VQHPSILQSLDLNTLQLLNFELDLLRCVFETSHKYSNCRCLPKNIATRTAHLVSKQQLVMTEVPPLHIASFTSHFDSEPTSLFQAVKYQTFLIFKKNRFRYRKEKSVILINSMHHILLSNAVTVAFVPRAHFHQSFPYHCPYLPSQSVLNYMRKLTSAINAATTIIIPILLDNL
jgi:hypothetical protein